jgi:carboxymethylenebutenolidase
MLRGMKRLATGVLCFLLAACSRRAPAQKFTGETVSFRSGNLTLQGSLYRPAGPGPFPAVVYNHGSACSMIVVDAAEALGPVFTARGWMFFMPHRRGAGLSAKAGPCISDEIDAAEKKGGMRAAVGTMLRLLEHDHLDDQMAALAWLQSRPDVQHDRIAVAGNSFGGIEAVLGAERGGYCAAIDSAGGAMSWATAAPDLENRLTFAVRNARAPIFFFQAENDFDLTPTRVLSAAMKAAGKPYEAKIYPAFGTSKKDGHTLGYFGSRVWADDVFRFLAAHCPPH